MHKRIHMDNIFELQQDNLNVLNHNSSFINIQFQKMFSSNVYKKKMYLYNLIDFYISVRTMTYNAFTSLQIEN